MEKDALYSSCGSRNQHHWEALKFHPCSLLTGCAQGTGFTSLRPQILNHKMRDLNSMGSGRFIGANEKHFKFPQFYKIKHTDDPKKIASQVTFALQKYKLLYRELIPCLARNSLDPLGWEENKLRAQTPASKPVGISNHSDGPFAVIVLSYPINWLFKYWEVDASCQLTIIPITSIAHICFTCIAPVSAQIRRDQLNYD